MDYRKSYQCRSIARANPDHPYSCFHARGFYTTRGSPSRVVSERASALARMWYRRGRGWRQRKLPSPRRRGATITFPLYTPGAEHLNNNSLRAEYLNCRFVRDREGRRAIKSNRRRCRHGEWTAISAEYLSPSLANNRNLLLAFENCKNSFFFEAPPDFSFDLDRPSS